MEIITIASQVITLTMNMMKITTANLKSHMQQELHQIIQDPAVSPLQLVSLNLNIPLINSQQVFIYIIYPTKIK